MSSSPDVPVIPHACVCGRRFVVVPGRQIVSPPRCVCGRALSLLSLPSGVYEVKRSRRASRRRLPRVANLPPLQGVPASPDLGYGESHGYGPAHGGPTGPGDAPAPPPSDLDASVDEA